MLHVQHAHLKHFTLSLYPVKKKPEAANWHGFAGECVGKFSKVESR